MRENQKEKNNKKVHKLMCQGKKDKIETDYQQKQQLVL